MDQLPFLVVHGGLVWKVALAAFAVGMPLLLWSQHGSSRALPCRDCQRRACMASQVGLLVNSFVRRLSRCWLSPVLITVVVMVGCGRNSPASESTPTASTRPQLVAATMSHASVGRDCRRAAIAHAATADLICQFLERAAGCEFTSVDLASIDRIDTTYWRHEYETVTVPMTTTAGLECLPNLTELDINGNANGHKLRDISSLSALRELRSLRLSRNELTDIAPLRSLTALTHLYLQGNKIADIKPPVSRGRCCEASS